jgi:seryl-tRNA synthetase
VHSKFTSSEKGSFVKPRLDYRYVRDNVEAVADNASRRHSDADAFKVAALYERFTALKQQAIDARAVRNSIAKRMQELAKSGNKKTATKSGRQDATGQMSDSSAASVTADAAEDVATKRVHLIEEGRLAKAAVAKIEVDTARVGARLEQEALCLPNITSPLTPTGGEGDHREIRRVLGRGSWEGAMADKSDAGLAGSVRSHVDIAAAHDLVDLEAAARTTGAGFWYLKREAALLEMALIQWAMHRGVREGFIPFLPPDVVRTSVVEACGFRPRLVVDDEDDGSDEDVGDAGKRVEGHGDDAATHLDSQIYSLSPASKNLCLAGTAEVPMCALFYDTVLPEARLPHRAFAFSHAFRQEADDSNGGIYRGHQFSKVEMFAHTTPGDSDATLEAMIDLQERMFTELGLAFRIIEMPSGDLGAPAYRKVDMEAWLPASNSWAEISSASSCTDYQSRRLNIRYEPAVGAQSKAASAGGKAGTASADNGGAKPFVHTVNATAVAVPRTIIAILEQYQRPDGSIGIPECLQPYMMGYQVIPFLPRN